LRLEASGFGLEASGFGLRVPASKPFTPEVASPKSEAFKGKNPS